MKNIYKNSGIEISTDIVDRKWIDVNIPCKKACPIMTDIPGYIQAIMEGDFERAYRINRRDNVLPSILGRVCHRPCESACRHGWDGLGDPVSICFLKRSSADLGFETSYPKIAPNGKSICIVGSGPAGLTAANDLALLGYEVTVLEQFQKTGGMLRYGLPQFRLPHDIVDQDVESIIRLGVKIETGKRIEGEAEFKNLTSQYDAVILAGGCMLAKELDIPGLDSKGSFYGLDFMMKANLEQINYPVRKVVVIGGGFTAVDCARIAYRLGAEKISIAFLFTRDMMGAGAHEIDAMEAEGVEFAFLVTPVAVESKDGRVIRLRLSRNQLQPDKSVKTIADSEFIIDADTIVFAIGQKEEREILGKLLSQPADNFFLAGDFRYGAATVIEAAADGRKTAREVHRFLTALHGYEDRVRIQPVEQTGRERNDDFIPLQPMDELPLSQRRNKNAEVELGFSKEKALIEARRCYLCHFNFQIDIASCIYCLACIDVMPVDCIKMAKDIEVSEDGSLNYVDTSSWSEVQAIAIDNNKCIRCGNCYRVCPVECISISRYELETVPVD